MQLEQVDDAIAAALAQMPLAIPQMAMGGMDPREMTLQIAKARDMIAKGKEPVDAIIEVFAPKEAPPAAADPMAALQQQAQTPAGLPGQGGGGASDMLMMLAGMTPGGNSNLQANVSRMRPVQG